MTYLGNVNLSSCYVLLMAGINSPFVLEATVETCFLGLLFPIQGNVAFTGPSVSYLRNVSLWGYVLLTAGFNSPSVLEATMGMCFLGSLFLPHGAFSVHNPFCERVKECVIFFSSPKSKEVPPSRVPSANKRLAGGRIQTL